MTSITVAKPFSLTLASGDVQSFGVGVHDDVSAEVAEHWFTAHHLAKNGKAAVTDPAKPLSNEERAAVKAAIDAAEDRAQAAEQEAAKARDERDNIKSAFSKLADENMALKTRIAELESDLDKATKPVAQPNAKKAA